MKLCIFESCKVLYDRPSTYQLQRPELLTDIYYLTEREGGRKTPVASGYRGQFHYNRKDFDAMQQFVDKSWCQLGETVQVLMQTASPEFHAGQLFVGKEFKIREGSKTVGKGTITKILRPDFNYWDTKLFLENLNSKIMPYGGIDMQGYRMTLTIIYQIQSFSMT
jgi:Elongation factor Tu C-terminal domain